ncbi:MAG: hypothetical protein GW859_02545 [Sphingomonadales bacterium]|nr:hypothetical protein [Sphingomonadales bacterium]
MMFAFLSSLIAALAFGQPSPAHAAAVESAPVTAPASVATLPTDLPASYAAWLARGDNRARVVEFEAELSKHRLSDIVPTYQILRTAIDWKRCGASEYELPDRASWDGAFASLGVIRDELVPLLGRVEIVSGYRNPALNACAGGASGSVHRQFGAFDAFAVSQPSRAVMIDKLCTWYRGRADNYHAGLGIYSGQKFHIDAGIRSTRTWGSDYHRASSPCVT